MMYLFCVSLGMAALVAGWPRSGAAQIHEPDRTPPFSELPPDEQAAFIHERLAFWRRVKHLLRARRTARTSEERAALRAELEQSIESTGEASRAER